ncbi:MAG: DUF971 domain-containing protein [Aquabacterium sp.]|uniref:DUF971 domain-containing protein n=1 Tax=Aquabacterium sp. TaxID=1872578 RepID=UPI00271E0E82|nr:DUF971 domain-containing protein [Aquabacterium sp.]MDO9002473.1 DUF971 domain-containing protein [Aquabacterium sp.]
MIEELLIDQQREVLTLRLEDGRCIDLPDAMLRAACKCAFCESGRRKGELPQVAEGTHIVGWESMGAAIHLKFSDGHVRGIYPYPYLVDLAEAQAAHLPTSP